MGPTVRAAVTVQAKLRLRAVQALLALLLGASAMLAESTFSQDRKSEPRMTLRSIMQELGAEYLRLTNALLTDDFNGLEQSAKAIQGHPLPDEIVAAIRAKLDRNFRGFERIDDRGHQAAADLSKRAAARDISGSAKAFGRLAESCVSCHKEFRATLRPLSD
jgi:cytochrome c556